VYASFLSARKPVFDQRFIRKSFRSATHQETETIVASVARASLR
jgi:hypothetical protein